MLVLRHEQSTHLARANTPLEDVEEALGLHPACWPDNGQDLIGAGHVSPLTGCVDCKLHLHSKQWKVLTSETTKAALQALRVYHLEQWILSD